MKVRKDVSVIIIVIIACTCMGIVDAVIQPGYVVKSFIKIILFLFLPILYSLYDKDCQLKKLFKPQRKGLILALSMGLVVYLIILISYFIFKNVFNFSALTTSLTSTTGVNKDNFLWVALYISFVNSLLEEFFFRGFAFLTLKRTISRNFSYIFSSSMFATYHIAMMIGWFKLPVIILTLIGLFVGGIIFNYFNEKWNNIYLSWLIHMFANFAINTIGAILFRA